MHDVGFSQCCGRQFWHLVSINPRLQYDPVPFPSCTPTQVLVRTMLVNDLKLILKSFSLSTSGRKQCLQTRVLHLIDTHKEVARVEQAILTNTRRHSHAYRPHPKPHHVPSLDPLTGMPLYSGLPNLVPPAGLPPAPFERKPNRVPVVFHHLTYAQRKQMILAPEMLGVWGRD